MRFIFLILLLFIQLLPLLTIAQSGNNLNVKANHISFKEFVAIVENGTGHKFFYRPQDTDSIKVTVSVSDRPIEEVLKEALTASGLQFSIDYEKRIYITKDRSIMTDLPVGFFPDKTLAKKQESNFDYSEYERQERKKKVEETKLYNIGDRSSKLEGTAVITGVIRDATNGEPVIAATLFIEKLNKGVSTDQFGYYSFTLPKGRHDFIIKSIGMKTTIRKVMLYSNGALNIELDQAVTPLKEIVIESQHEARINNLQMGTEKLDISTMKQIPLALGETDVMKVVLTLPGVQSVGEGTVGINVRGGATNQNLILLNDAVVYNPSHLFGFFSTFNPDILKNVELYKSGIKAQYGGRLSSVLDVHTREGNSKKITGSGGISPITGRFSIEGPIVKEKTTFILGIRSTYSNWVLRQLDDKDLRKSKASFYDVTAGITHKIDDNNSLYISAYNSSDQFNLKNDTSYLYSDRNGSLKWKKIFNNRLVGIVTGTYSNYTYNMKSDRNPVNAFDMDFNIQQYSLKADVNYFYNEQHTVDAGISSTRYFLSPGTIKPLGAQSLIMSDKVEEENALETAVYISDTYEFSPQISIYAGIRFSLYQYFGAKSTYQYAPNAPRNSGNIVDTINYRAGETIKTYNGLEPRIGIKYVISNDFSIKFSYNKMKQYIQMLSNTTAISPTDIWKLSDLYIPPQTGHQISIGFYKNFVGKRLIETSIEAYYKKMKNTLDFKGAAILLLNRHIETDVVPADGDAYGIELLVKKNAGKVNGWISYAYSRSLLTTKGTYSDEIVNNGNSYPNNFDKPHAFNFIGNYKFSRRFNFSANFVYSTGRPITLPIAKYDVGGAPKVYYSERNAYRIPDYIRTDISINIEGNHKIKKLAHSSWTFAVYNLFSRANAYSVYFTNENGQIKGYKLSIFARAIPTITYNFRF